MARFVQRLFVGIACAALLSCSYSTQAEETPDFTVKSATDDSTFQLSKQQGKIVVLHFLLKTECPFCVKYTHDYSVYAEQHPEVVHVFLKPDTEAEIASWIGKLDKSDLEDLPKVYRDIDAKLADRFKIPSGYKFHGQTVHYPALVVLNENGKELFRYVGKSNSDRMSTKDFATKLAAVTQKSTKSSKSKK